MKKRVKRASKSKASVSMKKSPLSGAIKDLETEIRKLSRERTDLKAELTHVGTAIDVDRSKERELQQRIAILIEKEAKLNQRKKNLQTKIDRVADKVNKISKIKSEMADI